MMLEFEVARMLGMTVARLRHELGGGELVEWSAFLGLEAQWRELAAKQVPGG